MDESVDLSVKDKISVVSLPCGCGKGKLNFSVAPRAREDGKIGIEYVIAGGAICDSCGRAESAETDFFRTINKNP